MSYEQMRKEQEWRAALIEAIAIELDYFIEYEVRPLRQIERFWSWLPQDYSHIVSEAISLVASFEEVEPIDETAVTVIASQEEALLERFTASGSALTITGFETWRRLFNSQGKLVVADDRQLVLGAIA